MEWFFPEMKHQKKKHQKEKTKQKQKEKTHKTNPPQKNKTMRNPHQMHETQNKYKIKKV